MQNWDVTQGDYKRNPVDTNRAVKKRNKKRTLRATVIILSIIVVLSFVFYYVIPHHHSIEFDTGTSQNASKTSKVRGR